MEKTEDACKLGEPHRGELLPPVKATVLPFVAEALALDPGENMEVNK